MRYLPTESPEPKKQLDLQRYRKGENFRSFKRRSPNSLQLTKRYLRGRIMIIGAFIVGFIAGWIINEKLENGIKKLNPWYINKK